MLFRAAEQQNRARARQHGQRIEIIESSRRLGDRVGHAALACTRQDAIRIRHRLIAGPEKVQPQAVGDWIVAARARQAAEQEA